jgi:AAA ATPase domain
MLNLSGRPLLDNQLDAALVVGRDDVIARVAEAVATDLNVLLVGERGSGRTTLLRQVAHRLRQDAVPSRWIDASTALTTQELIDLITAGLLDSSGRLDGKAADGWPLQRLMSAGPEAFPSVVLLDNAVPAAAHGLFGTLRDEVWQLPVRWAISCTDRDRATFLRPPADAFFDVVATLPPLSEDEAQALVRARVPDGQLSAAALETIVEIGGGNPRALLTATRTLLNGAGASPGTLADSARQRTRQLSALSPAAAHLVADLEASGPASASDPALLARHGWTRSRATQLLRELLDAGLVEPTTVRNGPGRPRTVYAAVTVRP